MTETIHCSLDIEGALRRPGYWRKMFTVSGSTMSTDEFRHWLVEELRAGRTAIPLGCPSPRADGSCPGHASEERP
jgi:hypothetical protein